MISNSNDDFIGKETVNLKIFKDYISSLENQWILFYHQKYDFEKIDLKV